MPVMDEVVLENRKRNKIKWEIEANTDREWIFSVARTMGWLDTPPKVQVRRTKGIVEDYYSIERFDDCHCPDMIKPF